MSYYDEEEIKRLHAAAIKAIPALIEYDIIKREDRRKLVEDVKKIEKEMDSLKEKVRLITNYIETVRYTTPCGCVMSGMILKSK